MGPKNEDETEEASDGVPSGQSDNFDAADPNINTGGLQGGGEPSTESDDEKPDLPPENENFGGPPMAVYYPVYLPPMCAPPQPFGYVYQDIPEDGYRTMQISPDEFRFYKDDLTEETEKMMESMCIPMYGPKIKPVENQGDLYGGATAAETNFMYAQ